MKPTTISKTAAIATAREHHSMPFVFGSGWKFSQFDPTVNAWRESRTFPTYAEAMLYRGANCAGEAAFLVTGEEQARYTAEYAVLNNPGAWVDHVPATA